MTRKCRQKRNRDACKMNYNGNRRGCIKEVFPEWAMNEPAFPNTRRNALYSEMYVLTS